MISSLNIGMFKMKIRKVLEILVLSVAFSLFLIITYWLIESWILEGNVVLLLDFGHYNEHYIEIPLMVLTTIGLGIMLFKRC